MDPHQPHQSNGLQPGGLDALISEGLALQGNPHELENLLHQSVQDVLGDPLPDLPLPALGGSGELGLHGQWGLPSGDGANGDGSVGFGLGHGGTGNGIAGDVDSQAQPTNVSGVRTRRRAAAIAAGYFGTDQEGGSDDEADSMDDEDEGQETGSSGRPGQGTKRRRGGGSGNGTDGNGKSRRAQNMKGRFSGRLPTKDAERQLVEECRLMGPLLSEGGELLTLPVIIRAMASGEVRQHLEKRDREWQEMRARLQALDLGGDASVLELSDELAKLKMELDLTKEKAASLERQVAHSTARDGAAAAATRSGEALQQEQEHYVGLQRMGSVNTATVAAALPTLQSVNISAPMEQQQAQQAAVISAPMAGLAVAQLVQMSQAPAPALAAAADPQALPQQPAPVVLTSVPLPAVSILRVPSSAALLTATTAPQSTAPSAPPPATASAEGTGSGELGADPAAAAAGVAATSLNEQAQQLAVAATMHAAAKTEASVQAQHLAAQAQQHAQASVQAAQQAEELKQTLAVLPDSVQAQQAAATVHNLEARAQAHASITSQVVAQARGMHEKAQAHEKEQLKAITQATVLQAHAQSLHASAQQLEAHGAQQASADQAHSAAVTVAAHPGLSAPSAQLPPPALPSLQPAQTFSSGDPHGLPTTPPSATYSAGNANAIFAPAPTAAAVLLPTSGIPSVTLPLAQPGAPLQAPQPTAQALVLQQPALPAVQVAPVAQLSAQAIAVQADAVALMQQASAAAHHVQQQQQQAAAVQHQQQVVAAVKQQAQQQAAAAEQSQVAALQQQIAVLQAQQAMQQVAHQAQQQAAEMAAQVAEQSAPPLRPAVHAVPFGVAPQLPHTQPFALPPATAPLAAISLGQPAAVPGAEFARMPSHGSTSLQQATVVATDSAAAAAAPSSMQLDRLHGAHEGHHALPLQHHGPGGSCTLDVPVGMEGLLPTLQPLPTDAASAQAAASMAPVVSIPDLPTPHQATSLPSGAEGGPAT